MSGEYKSVRHGEEVDGLTLKAQTDFVGLLMLFYLLLLLLIMWLELGPEHPEKSAK